MGLQIDTRAAGLTRKTWVGLPRWLSLIWGEAGPGSSRLPHVPPPNLEEDSTILNCKSSFSCWGQGLFQGHRSGDTEGTQALACQRVGAPGPVVWGWMRSGG